MPHYPLNDIKALIRSGNFQINRNALQSAYNDFQWGPSEIAKCILKFNARKHSINREKNHFHKTEAHWHLKNTMMDYYKAKNVMQDCNVYTHFYIHPTSKKLVISSFKEL